MKTKIRQVIFLLAVFIVASAVSANAQSNSPNYPALIAAAQAKIAQYQAALNSPHTNPTRTAAIQNAIAQLQQKVASYQAIQSPPQLPLAAHATTLQAQAHKQQQQPPQQTPPHATTGHPAKTPPAPNTNPLLEKTGGRTQTPVAPK